MPGGHLAVLGLAAGFCLFILGLSYLFRPGLVLRFNAFMRNFFFHDSFVLLDRRRIGFVLLVVSFFMMLLALRSSY